MTYTLRKVIFLFVAFVILALMILAKIAPRKPEHQIDKETAVNIQREGLAAGEKNDWPMFHFGPKLQGYVQNNLSDSLELLWKFKTDDEIKSSAAIAKGKVFIGSSDANVYAIDLENGSRVWSYKTGGPIEATACVVDGTVYIGSADGFLYALDMNTGRFKWKCQTEGKISGSANWTGGENGQDIQILVGSYDNQLYCLNSKDGKVVWSYETDSYVNGTAAVYDGRIVFGGCDGMMHVV